MNPSRKSWVWIGSIVATILVVAVVVIAVMVRHSSPTQPVSKAPTPVYAPQGELIPQFPKDLILGPAAVVSQSYSLSYSSATNQYTAEFNSSSSMTSLYASYVAYLPAHGWTVTNQLTSFANSRGVSATNASSSVQVSIVAHNGGSQVIVGYVTK